MSLRELKKEVYKLPSIKDNAHKLQVSWLKGVKSDRKIPFLENLPDKIKKEVKKKILETQRNLEEIKLSESINEKLKHYARYLIELKLTTINGNKNKAKMITNLLLNDDFLKLKNTITDIKAFQKSVNTLTRQHNYINWQLQKYLSLDETVSLIDLSDSVHLKNLQITAEKQRVLVKQMGGEFISLVKESQLWP